MASSTDFGISFLDILKMLVTKSELGDEMSKNNFVCVLYGDYSVY